MSKRSLFWGNGSGKLGEAVFYRAGGEQRTRTYVKTVKNPKSYQQALQRAKFNNMVGTYKAISTAVQSFFTDRQSNQSPFNAYFRLNWPQNLWVADKEITGVNEGVFSGFYVSNGKFQLDTTLTPQLHEEAGVDPEKYYLGWNIPVGNFTIPINGTNGFVVLGSQWYELLVGSTNPFGLPSEFNVSVIIVKQGFACNGAQLFTVKCSANSQEHLRFVQGSPRLEVPTQRQIDLTFMCLNGEITEATDTAAGGVTGVSKIAVGKGGATAADIPIGAAVVVSFKDASGKQCTKSSIVYGQELTTTAADYRPDSEVGMSIISQYQTVSALIE